MLQINNLGRFSRRAVPLQFNETNWNHIAFVARNHSSRLRAIKRSGATAFFQTMGACTEDLAFGSEKEARYMKRNEAYGDIINLILAIWLFLSPWLIGFAGIVPAAWTAWLSAIAIAIISIAALSAFAEWEEWINLLLGVWVLISPWVVHVSGQQAPTVVLFLTGLAVAIIAIIELSMLHRTPPRVTA